MANTLMLYHEHRAKAWDLLGADEAGAYGDNGGDPDGSAWLPSEEVSGDLAAQVVANGWGQMVHVLYANDEAMMNQAGYTPPEWPDGDEDAEEQAKDGLQHYAEEHYAAWAHYGAYGASDSRWVLMTR